MTYQSEYNQDLERGISVVRRTLNRGLLDGVSIKNPCLEE